MNEKGEVIEINDPKDLNPESTWGTRRKKLGDARTSLGGSDVAGL